MLNISRRLSRSVERDKLFVGYLCQSIQAIQLQQISGFAGPCSSHSSDKRDETQSFLNSGNTLSRIFLEVRDGFFSYLV